MLLGTSATRRSPGQVSLGTEIFMGESTMSQVGFRRDEWHILRAKLWHKRGPVGSRHGVHSSGMSRPSQTACVASPS